MRIKYNGTINASSDKDYASLKGTDFDKAKAVLTNDGYKEHEYGDKDDNNGYAVYRKGDKEVELTYEWIKGKRNGEAHAGKVLDVYVDDNINGACGNKRSVKAAYDNEDIVMYWDGQKVYEGPVDGNMTREIVWFLDDPEKLQEIVDYCNSFGDPVIEDTSNLMDVAATFVEMVDYELKEANSIDDDVYVSDEAGHFEIFEKSKEVTGAKKSVKCSTDGKVPYDLVSMLVALRDYADVSDAYVNDEHGKLVDIADSLYNVGRDVIDKMKPEFKKVYEKYGSDYFDTVLDDISALDSQLTRNNVNDLIADYEDRANNFNGVEGACGGKKPVKAAQEEQYDVSFKLKGTTYYIQIIEDGGNYVAKWWDSSDNGLGYNNKGWVALNNDFGRNTGKFNSENIESLLGIISEFDRKPSKPVQDRIKREVAKLINFDIINSSTRYNSITAAADITNLKIIVDGVGYVEVLEDGYETGEGEYVKEWTFDISGTYNNMQEVVDAIANEVGTTNDVEDYVYIDGRIDTDMEQNAEGLRPTDAEYEAWRRGEETLYVAHISVYLNVGAEIHEMTEDEAEAFGLPLY